MPSDGKFCMLLKSSLWENDSIGLQDVGSGLVAELWRENGLKLITLHSRGGQLLARGRIVVHREATHCPKTPPPKKMKEDIKKMKGKSNKGTIRIKVFVLKCCIHCMYQFFTIFWHLLYLTISTSADTLLLHLHNYIDLHIFVPRHLFLTVQIYIDQVSNLIKVSTKFKCGSVSP